VSEMLVLDPDREMDSRFRGNDKTVYHLDFLRFHHIFLT